MTRYSNLQLLLSAFLVDFTDPYFRHSLLAPIAGRENPKFNEKGSETNLSGENKHRQHLFFLIPIRSFKPLASSVFPTILDKNHFHFQLNVSNYIETDQILGSLFTTSLLIRWMKGTDQLSTFLSC